MAKLTPEEVKDLVAKLEAMVSDSTALANISSEDRVALMKAAGRVSRPSRDEKKRASKAFRVVNRKRSQDHDRTVRAATEIRTARLAEVFAAPPQLLVSTTDNAPTEASSAGDARTQAEELKKPRACYVCKAEYTRVHFFYDSMCGACAELNYAKRFQTASLKGRYALITGARVKIGFQAALMMLRAGAHVIVTTRFPRDAASRYAREPDFASWRDRLEVHGLDLRHSPSVEMFARYLSQTKPHLDILINNAAQTVRRPPGFYAHMLADETKPFVALPADVQSLLRGHETCKSAIVGKTALELAATDAHDPMTVHDDAARSGAGFVAWRGDGPGPGIRSSAMLSQIPCEFDDPNHGEDVFPTGQVDADLQQIDLRASNSWRMTLSQVPSPEMLEVQLVNAVAPFILCSKLKELMMRNPTGDRHIVNVSAMEGQFSRRTKTDKHPHTNMAKAALNMMTLTSAPDYAAHGIFMNAVDTGWVTDEDAAQLSKRKQEMHDFQPPLDIVDGAARICDPFFSGLLTGRHVSGKFLKDYAECPW